MLFQLCFGHSNLIQAYCIVVSPTIPGAKTNTPWPLVYNLSSRPGSPSIYKYLKQQMLCPATRYFSLKAAKQTYFHGFGLYASWQQYQRLHWVNLTCSDFKHIKLQLKISSVLCLCYLSCTSCLWEDVLFTCWCWCSVCILHTRLLAL